KLFVVVGALFAIGGAAAGGLYFAYPVQVSIFGGLTRNYLITLFAPSGTATTESNAAYKGVGTVTPRLLQRYRRAQLREIGRATTKHSLRSVTRSSARSIRRMLPS